MILPGLVVLLRIAPGVVDGDELLCDLLPMADGATGHLVGRDVEVEAPATDSRQPTSSGLMVERKRFGGKIVGVPDIEDSVLLGLAGRVWLLHDGVHSRPLGCGPAPE